MVFNWLNTLKKQRINGTRRRKATHRLSGVAVESLQPKVLLSASHGDHPALKLVDHADATNTAVASGNWSDAATWQDGNIPAAGARVVIPMGQTVTVDGMISEEFKTVRVDGTLNFKTDTNTELRVDTLVSSMHGRVEIGTAADPIQSDVSARVVFADDGAIDRSWDPQQFSRGAMLFGSTEVVGADSTHRESLAVHPTAGSTTLELSAAPTGWNVGDEIVITGTQGSTSDEVRTIDSISGTTVTLNQQLDLDHVPPRSDLNVYVANTTRNVEFASENATLAHRGHIMFAHNPNTHIKNAKFTELGRTNKKVALDDLEFIANEDAVGNRTSAYVDYTLNQGPANNIRGRYAVHFHRTGNDPGSTPATIDGSVVVGSPGWGFVNHSSNVDITNNVAYGVHGASFYTEAGDEIGTIENNIAIRTVNPDFRLEDNGEISVDLRAEQQDFGVDGDGFWLSGHMVNFRNNISAGASGHGIIYWTDGLIEADKGRTQVKVANIENGHLIPNREMIPTWWAPMADIQNNEAFGATIGFRARYIHSSIYLGDPGSSFHEPPPQEYIDTLSPTVDGLKVWGSRDGALLNYNERLSLKNADIIGIGAEYVRQGGTTDLGVGIDMYNDASRGPGVVENVNVEGFNMGILAPRHDGWEMSNIRLKNTTDMLITKGTNFGRTLTMNNITFGDLTGTAVEDQAANRQNIVMDGEGDENQPFWFLLDNDITLDGQTLYFNEQAADYVPLTAENQCHFLIRIPDEFVGKTNQELRDTFGTSFGGDITPEDATAADFLSGGVVGSAPTEESTDPPLYDMRLESPELIDPGTLTNFDPNGGSGEGCDGGGGDDGDGDDGDGDDGDGDDGDGDDGDGDDGDGDDGDGDDGDGDDGDGDDGDGDDGDGDDGDGDDGDGDDGDGDDGDGDDGDGDDGDGDDGDGDDGDGDDGDGDDGDGDDGDGDDGDGDDGDGDDGDGDDGDGDDGDGDDGDGDDGDGDDGDGDDGDGDDGDGDDGDGDDGDGDDGDGDDGDGDDGDGDDGDGDDGDGDDGDGDDGDGDDGDGDDGDGDDGDGDDGDGDDGDGDDGDGDDGDGDDGDGDDGDGDDGDGDDGDGDDGDGDDGDGDDGDGDDGDGDGGDDGGENRLTVNLPEDGGQSKIVIKNGDVIVRAGRQVFSRDPIGDNTSILFLGAEVADNAVFDLRGLAATDVESVEVDAGEGDDRIVLKAIDKTFTGSIDLMGGVDNDELRAKPNFGVAIDGGDGNDMLFGGHGNDSLFGGDGDDKLVGGRGRDMLSGDDGNDMLRGGNGADSLSGGLGDDDIHGQKGNDMLVETGDIDFVLTDRSLRGLGRDRLRGITSARFYAGSNATLDDDLFSGDVEWITD